MSAFCGKCGKAINPNAVVCVGCGCKLGGSNNFCENCGNSVIPNADVCLHCGCAINVRSQSYSAPYGYMQKSRLTAGLLGIFLGSLGIGRFYLGYTVIGVLQILATIFTLGFGGLWGFIDGILIITGHVAVDANNMPLKE